MDCQLLGSWQLLKIFGRPKKSCFKQQNYVSDTKMIMFMTRCNCQF